MRLSLAWLILVMPPLIWADDPKPIAVSLVRTKLDAATEMVNEGQAERSREYEKITAEPIPDEAKEPKYRGASAVFHAMITPPIDDLLDAAADHPDDPATIEALRFVVINARGLATGQVQRAVLVLARDHVRAAHISTASGPLWLHHDKPEAVALLRAVMADNPSRLERARACHDLGFLLKFRVESAERFRARSPGTPLPSQWAGADLPALRAEAITLLDRSGSEFADVPVGDHAPGKTIGDFARGELTALRTIQVGQLAPEITGLDLDGHPLRLSDYRGQVVVLIFAGEWCGPCQAAAPYFRDLIKPEAQQTSPCVVLEVNTDSTRDPVRSAIKEEAITWPCWFDGGMEGPITLAWGVSSFPSIFVLDPEGVIRAKGIRGEATAAVVARVFKANPAGK